MPDNQVLHLAIQPARSVIRDTVQNKFWIGGFVLFIAMFRNRMLANYWRLQTR